MLFINNENCRANPAQAPHRIRPDSHDKENGKMQTIIIDDEFRDLLPALDEETYKALEENLLQNGCRDAIVLWEGVLVDGHNRYEICTKHGIPFNTVNKEFASRDDALIWIISTQVSRRNLTPIQLSHYRGLHYITDKKLRGNKSGKNQRFEEIPHNEEIPKSQSTNVRLAEKYKVSKSTIERDAKVAAAISAIGEVSPDAKRKILSGESNIDKKELERLSASPKEEIEAAAAEIENGAYGKNGKKADPARSASGQGQEQGKPASGQEKPVDTIIVGMAPLNAAIDKVAVIFHAELPKIKSKGDRTALKKALGYCIEKLEELSGQI